MGIKAIVTGASGMVGEGVLLECLADPRVSEVLVVGRRPCGVVHPKLREVLHADFHDLAPIADKLAGYDACYFCLGTSSVGMSEKAYKRATYDLTTNFGRTLAERNPDLTFCYLTGAGTDSSERGAVAWARVKGATENELMRTFKRAYMFRAAFMKAVPGQKNLKGLYKAFAWVYPIGRALYPAGFCTLQEVGRAMIHLTGKDHSKRVLDVPEIVRLAEAI